MINDNEMKLEFLSKSNNEAFARITVAAFVASLDPTIEEISDIKTAVSEAVTNSIVHGYEDKIGIINLKCKIKNREVTIEISDNGKGIDKEDIKHIFERFYKGKNSSRDSVGIGLALAKTIIEQNNGTISVESEIGKGTTFIIKYFE